MAKRKNSKKVAAGRKARPTRRRMASRRTVGLFKSNWKKARGKKRSLTVKRTKRGLMRSPYSRLGWIAGKRVCINPYRRRRRNPNGITKLLGRWRIQRAVPILAGFVGGVAVKPMLVNAIIPRLPVTMQEPARKWWGVITIALGATLANRSRRRMTMDVGLGMIVGGVYDVLSTNFAEYIPWLPAFAKAGSSDSTPASNGNGSTQSGLGASIGRGQFVTVGAANLDPAMDFDTVGSEDLDDLI